MIVYIHYASKKLKYYQYPPIDGKFYDFSQKHVGHYIYQILCLSRAKKNKNVGKNVQYHYISTQIYKKNSKPFIINVFENQNIPKSHHVGHYML